ncbi:questin oxidase family protein [Actinoplanes sp. NPDC089786]|uniref:questin oxidase family protein n=1 Tax=Actinoplanes sp. NPDC089786 TaxID=3155185 RepID=UPI003421D54D
MADGILDEALERLRDTGPERNGWLSNHAPMAAEALARRGHAAQVHRWLDGYDHLLEERPRGISPIPRDQWRDPLGDPVRTGDWLAFFERELTAAPWREVLAVWWPRLLPGIAAGATHGVIRVGHAVRALLDVETPPRVMELAHGLAYWAARWQPLALPAAGPYRASDPRAALDAVPRVPDQRFGIRHRLAQLAALDSWPAVPDSWPVVPGSSPAVPGSSPAVPGSSRAVPGSSPAVPGSSPAVPGSSPANPGSWPAAASHVPAAPGSWRAEPGAREREADKTILKIAAATATSPTPVGGRESSTAGGHFGGVVHRAAAGGVIHRQGAYEAVAVLDRLGGIVDAAVARQFTHGYGAPVMLVHAATAPAAVLRVLPALPARLWGPSLDAAWAAAAAVSAAYSPAEPRPVESVDGDPMEAAAATSDPHAIKFADAALDSLARTGDAGIRGRTVAAVTLIAAD